MLNHHHKAGDLASPTEGGTGDTPARRRASEGYFFPCSSV